MPVPALMMWTPGPLELVIMLVVVMMFFGVGKLPEVGKTLGRTLREFKAGQRTDALGEGEPEVAEQSPAAAEALPVR